MNTDLTDTQEGLIDRISRTSKKWVVRKMLTHMNANDRRHNQDDNRKLEEILRGLEGVAGGVGRIEQNTEAMPWLSKFMANIFKTGGGEAEKRYPSRKK